MRTGQVGGLGTQACDICRKVRRFLSFSTNVDAGFSKNAPIILSQTLCILNAWYNGSFTRHLFYWLSYWVYRNKCATSPTVYWDYKWVNAHLMLLNINRRVHMSASRIKPLWVGYSRGTAIRKCCSTQGFLIVYDTVGHDIAIAHERKNS